MIALLLEKSRWGCKLFISSVMVDESEKLMDALLLLLRSLDFRLQRQGNPRIDWGLRIGQGGASQRISGSASKQSRRIFLDGESW